MDLIKTGKLIASQRKHNNLTQQQLAEKLFVSEKTISKWECGKGFPDTSLILPLCKLLNISTNELLSGELLQNEKTYRQNAEENLITLKKEQEKTNGFLLNCELLIILFSVLLMIACTVISSYLQLQLVWKILIIIFGAINLAISVWICLVIETKTGFYECAKCKHKYIPSYSQTLWSMHMGRTRYMKCPHCGKKSWNKKVLTK